MSAGFGPVNPAGPDQPVGPQQSDLADLAVLDALEQLLGPRSGGTSGRRPP